MNVSAVTWASIPNFCARKSAATRSSGTRSSLARAFIPAISAERDPFLQPSQGREGRGRARLQVGPVEPDAFVRRKEAEVIAKHAEVVLPDLGVGRIEVGGLDLAARQGRGRPGRDRGRGRRAGASHNDRERRASHRTDP